MKVHGGMSLRTDLPLPAFVLHPLTAVGIAVLHVYLSSLIGETSRHHSLTFKKENGRRKLVIRPVNNGYSSAHWKC
jgi:hypothetical protein